MTIREILDEQSFSSLDGDDVLYTRKRRRTGGFLNLGGDAKAFGAAMGPITKYDESKILLRTDGAPKAKTSKSGGMGGGKAEDKDAAPPDAPDGTKKKAGFLRTYRTALIAAGVLLALLAAFLLWKHHHKA